jgi:hypothetical protein
MSRKRGIMQKVSAALVAHSRNKSACKRKGHLWDFVQYRGCFDMSHHEKCSMRWPASALCKCRRCDKLDVVPVKVPNVVTKHLTMLRRVLKLPLPGGRSCTCDVLNQALHKGPTD